MRNGRRSPTALKRPDRSKQCHCLQFAKEEGLFCKSAMMLLMMNLVRAIFKRILE